MHSADPGIPETDGEMSFKETGNSKRLHAPQSPRNVTNESAESTSAMSMENKDKSASPETTPGEAEAKPAENSQIVRRYSVPFIWSLMAAFNASGRDSSFPASRIWEEINLSYDGWQQEEQGRRSGTEPTREAWALYSALSHLMACPNMKPLGSELRGLMLDMHPALFPTSTLRHSNHSQQRTLPQVQGPPSGGTQLMRNVGNPLKGNIHDVRAMMEEGGEGKLKMTGGDEEEEFLYEEDGECEDFEEDVMIDADKPLRDAVSSSLGCHVGSIEYDITRTAKIGVSDADYGEGRFDGYVLFNSQTRKLHLCNEHENQWHSYVGPPPSTPQELHLALLDDRWVPSSLAR